MNVINLTPTLEPGREPKRLRHDLWIFPPNRDCNGGTAWWLDVDPEPVLIDCPPVTEATLVFLNRAAGDRTPKIVLTSREGHGRLRRLQEALRWPVLVQEQEAYLLPNLLLLDTFAEAFTTLSGLQLLWTPGPTPGSCVLLAPPPANVLFCGRLLTPLGPGCLGTIRQARTFHWFRQLASVSRLRDWIPPETCPELASGAALGALKGELLVPYSGWTPPPSLS